MRRTTSTFLYAFGAVGLLIFGSFFWILILPALQDPVKFFDGRRSQSVEIRRDSTWRENGLILSSFHVVGKRNRQAERPSLEFDAYLCRPEEPSASLPGFVLVGGVHTGRDAIWVISQRPEIAQLGVFITLDYPYSGPMWFENAEIFLHLPTIRQAAFNSVEAIRLAIDQLEGLPEVDPDRIVLLGVSFGSFFAIAAGAADPRPDAVMAYMGGAHIGSLIEWGLLRNKFLTTRFLSWPLASFAGLLFGPLEPVRLVGRISPRPYIQVSARDDAMIPVENALALFEAAREPKKLIWMPAPHLLPGMEDMVEEMIAIADEELSQWGLL